MFFPDTSWEQISANLPNNINLFTQSFLSSYIYKNNHWIFSFSGGGDSVATFWLVLAYLESSIVEEEKNNFFITLLYFDHALAYSKEETAKRMEVIYAAQNWAKQKNFCCEVTVQNIHTERLKHFSNFSFEACAGKLRHRSLLRLAQKFKKQAHTIVFDGHSLSDWYETVLMRLQRGASFFSMIPLQELETQQQVLWCRPLAMLFRFEIRNLLKKYNVPFWDDPSNQDTTIERNYVRENFVPYRKDGQAGLRKTAMLFLQEEQERKNILQKNLAKADVIRPNMREFRIDWNKFLTLEKYEQANIKIFFLKQLGLWPLSASVRKKLSRLPFVYSPFVMEKENWHGKIFLVARRGNNRLTDTAEYKKQNTGLYGNVINAQQVNAQMYIEQKYGRKKIKKILSEFKVSKRQRELIFLQVEENSQTNQEILQMDMSLLGLPVFKKEKKLLNNKKFMSTENDHGK